MTAPKSSAACSSGVKPEQLAVCITIQRAKAGPEQLAAWRRLWVKLLAPSTTTTHVDKPEEGKASIRRSDERIGCQENGNDHT